MCIETRAFLALLRDLLGDSASTRELASDNATDWITGYSNVQSEILVSILLWIAEQESDETALEAELHAAAEIAENAGITRNALLALDAIDRQKLTGSAVEHYEYLRSLSSGN
ncbi:hypothetical protein [Nocardia brasiliensis]|uniref:hypothetical protein n=1 Tax=Nocardia brasiliensis TaxID=37326 RepID=UPI0024572D16|nr:hypothetical protein [Nocardia brasiliensis]